MEFSIDVDVQRRIDEARELGAKEFRPAGLEADRNAAPLPVDHPFFERCIERGEGRTRWQGLNPPSARPAPTRTVVGTLLVMEELAYWDRGIINAIPGPGLPEQSVLSMGTDEQKEKYLGPFLEPDRPRWACFAMTEPGAGSDAAALTTNAKRDGDGWILNGAKCFIGSASRSDWLLVQATVDPSKGRGGQRAFFVERGTEGLADSRSKRKWASSPMNPHRSPSTTSGSRPLTNSERGDAMRKKQASKQPCRPSTPGGPLSRRRQWAWRVPFWTKPSTSPRFMT